ncbi:MAG TPA: GIY-YIG nuclease family protein [Bacilli bacterium]|nr:GIY-YIG nuclease family protein [Bacilli bacterium]
MSETIKGYVYVLTNPSFRDDWVKIGKSARDPEVRGKELYNAAVPLPYEIYATLKTEKYAEAEKMLHRMIDRISNLRIAANREFFNIAPETVYEILLDVADVIADAEVTLYGDNVQVDKSNGARAKRKASAL